MLQGLVSVIMPVFNRERYVRKAILSVLEQTYKDVDIVVVNDGSTDGSLQVMEEIRKDYPNKVTLINQTNKGQVVSRNNAIKEARGEFIAFLDSDDLWLPEKLELQIPLFVADVGLVYCAAYTIDEYDKIIGTETFEPTVKGNIYPHLLERNRMVGGSVVVRRNALDRVGLFDTSLPAAENWDLWIRISKLYRADLVNRPLMKYRKHQSNLSGDSLKMLSVVGRILEKHCSGKPESEELQDAYDLAHANFAYQQGIYFFARTDYNSARRHFKQAIRFKPGYRDSIIRLIRTYVGKSGNNFFANVRARLSR